MTLTTITLIISGLAIAATIYSTTMTLFYQKAQQYFMMASHFYSLGQDDDADYLQSKGEEYKRRADRLWPGKASS